MWPTFFQMRQLIIVLMGVGWILQFQNVDMTIKWLIYVTFQGPQVDYHPHHRRAILSNLLTLVYISQTSQTGYPQLDRWLFSVHNQHLCAESGKGSNAFNSNFSTTMPYQLPPANCG